MPTPMIHVLGGGAWQLPTVLRCRELGFRVLVTDPNLERPAYAHADAHERADITDAQATLAVSRRHGIAGILCDTTDWGVCTAAFVAEALGLPGIGLEAARNVTDKARMRQRTAAAGLPAPRFAELSSLHGLGGAADRVGLPLVVKPVDNQSGHGVSIVADRSGLDTAARAAAAASRQGRVLLEQVIEGVEIIVDGFVAQGRCEVLGIARKIPYDDNPTICSRIHYCEPHELPAPVASIEQAMRATVAALGLHQGLVHAEFIVGGGAITPIDVAARGGGVLIYRVVVPHVSGVDANRAAIELCAGGAPDVRPRTVRRCACIEFLRLPAGRLDAWHGEQAARSVPGIAALMLNAAAGDVVGSLADKDQRPGYVVALGETSADVLAAVGDAKARLGACMNGAPDRIAVL